MKRVLVIGGYGNFGCFISRRLAQEDNIALIIAGRSIEKATALANEINADAVQLDIQKDFAKKLSEINPNIVIHTSGPFQSQGYEVAEACIELGAHYIDLSDGREFVAGIEALNDKAESAGVTVISGASSVPCLTSALVDDFKSHFETIDTLDYGITTAQKTTRGLATTAAILSYTGHPFKTKMDGVMKSLYGWQGLRSRKYDELGWRLLGHCNVPDLEIFPKRYPQIQNIRFYAGLELPFIHLTLWALSGLVRIKLIKSLKPFAELMLKMSFWFDFMGSANSGFHMELKGRDQSGELKSICFELTAKSGDGPYIPCMPAILVAKKLANDNPIPKGAMPCIGLIDKDEYLNALSDLDIVWFEKVLKVS